MAIGRLLLLALISVITLASCSPSEGRVIPYTYAVELSPTISLDHAELSEIISEVTADYPELHIDIATSQQRKLDITRNVPGRSSFIAIGVWYGEDDDEQVMSVNDRSRPGHIWIVFMGTRKFSKSAEYQTRMMARIESEWPGADELPILPGGSLPLASDLQRTDQGYRISRAAAANYNLDESSDFLTKD